eukprot:COSAG02_NODE_26971_length_620_cov_0.689060_1_plen_64_part_10
MNGSKNAQRTLFFHEQSESLLDQGKVELSSKLLTDGTLAFGRARPVLWSLHNAAAGGAGGVFTH